MGYRKDPRQVERVSLGTYVPLCHLLCNGFVVLYASQDGRWRRGSLWQLRSCHSSGPHVVFTLWGIRTPPVLPIEPTEGRGAALLTLRHLLLWRQLYPYSFIFNKS